MVRADREIPAEERRKLSQFCNVRPSAVIQALDVPSIYDVPIAYHKEGLDTEVLAAFGIDPAPAPRMQSWEAVSERIHNPEGEVTIAIVGKYTGLKDAYKSLIEALYHGGIANRVKVKLEWIESEIFEKEDPSPWLEKVNGILVPGGFGERGAEGKISAAKLRPRTQGFPISASATACRWRCLMRRAIWPASRMRMSSEFDRKNGTHVVGIMTEWLKGNQLEKRARRWRSRRHHAAGRLSASAQARQR